MLELYSATSKIEIIEEMSMFVYETVNRITSRDYNPIFDTDFASLVRCNRFPSLLYGSAATFLKIGLWYGGAASSFIPRFSVRILVFYTLQGFLLKYSALISKHDSKKTNL